MKSTTFIYSLEFPKGNIRYIGKANDPSKRFVAHISRRNEGKTKKNSWIKSVLAKGFTPVLTVLDEVDSDEWEFWETHYIHLYRSFGFNLTNLTFGGDGLSNPTEEVKEKISKKLKENYINGDKPWNYGIKGVFIGEKSGNFGKKRTDEQKEVQRKLKLSLYKEKDVWNKGIPTGHTPWNKDKKGVMPDPWNKGTKGVMNAWNKGVKMSDESKRKCSENSTHSRSVLQFTLDGGFLKEWVSAKEAIKAIKCNGVNICCSGKSRSAGGYLWLWKDQYSEELIKNKVQEYRDKNKNKSRGSLSESPSSKKVEQINPITGEIITTYGSIKEAKLVTGSGNIGGVCNNKRETANGFKWRYKE